MKILLRLFSALLLMAAPLAAQVHTTDAPGMLEGPQTPGTPAPQKPADPNQMSNDTVLRMHSAGISDALIVQSINGQPGNYQTTANDLIALKSAGISDTILDAMMQKPRHAMLAPAAAPQQSLPVAPQVDEIGVYYQDTHGQWQIMESEAVHTKTSGWIKNTLSQGIIKQDNNGLVTGPEAKLVLHRPQQFLLYVPEGRDAGDYTLVLFRLNGKDREFRILTGGVFHSESGAKHDEVPFTAHRVAPHTYVFTLDRNNAGGGEYGILPPGTGNVTNGGKVYTFALVE